MKYSVITAILVILAFSTSARAYDEYGNPGGNSGYSSYNSGFAAVEIHEMRVQSERANRAAAGYAAQARSDARYERVRAEVQATVRAAERNNPYYNGY